MPELPEVETVRAGLAPELVGQRIARLQLRRADLRTPFPPLLQPTLEGATISSLGRRAKYLLMGLDNGHTALIHLGMSGRMLLHPALPNAYEKHDHVVMQLGNGAVVVFNDARRFGLWELAASADLAAHPLLVHLGPEPLSDAFTGAVLHAALATRKSAIKPTIMDQTIVVGVGNIYASESLFRAGIHPDTPAQLLSKAACERLVACIREVLAAAIASGGSTLRDYVRSSGDLGYFQHEFAVYGRAHAPCPRCGTPVTQVVHANRSTYFCARCQPKIRAQTPKKPRQTA